jgi:hypothetical protein
VHSDSARRLLLIPFLLLTILITSPTDSLIIYTCYLLSFTYPPGPTETGTCVSAAPDPRTHISFRTRRSGSRSYSSSTLYTYAGS